MTIRHPQDAGTSQTYGITQRSSCSRLFSQDQLPSVQKPSQVLGVAIRDTCNGRDVLAFLDQLIPTVGLFENKETQGFDFSVPQDAQAGLVIEEPTTCLAFAVCMHDPRDNTFPGEVIRAQSLVLLLTALNGLFPDQVNDALATQRLLLIRQDGG